MAKKITMEDVEALIKAMNTPNPETGPITLMSEKEFLDIENALADSCKNFDKNLREWKEMHMVVKDHIKGQVTFQFYRQGNLYYKTDSGLTFPVPVDDIGEATFLAQDKAILFMRYIRKCLDILNDTTGEKNG